MIMTMIKQLRATDRDERGPAAGRVFFSRPQDDIDLPKGRGGRLKGVLVGRGAPLSI